MKHVGRVMLALGLAFAALGFVACAPAGPGSSGYPSSGASYQSPAGQNPGLAASNPSSDIGAIHLSAGTLTDSQLGEQLTDYLHNHRLPLVGAQAYTDASGSRQVVLFGFVATTFGQRDAASRTRSLLNDPGISIVNRIKIDPSLMTPNGAPEPPAESASATAPSSPPMSGVQAYENQGDANRPYGGQTYSYQQQQQQNPSDWMTRMLPMLMGGGVGTGPGGGMSSFGGFSNSYGYGSPYGSPYPGGSPVPYSPFLP